MALASPISSLDKGGSWIVVPKVFKGQFTIFITNGKLSVSLFSCLYFFSCQTCPLLHDITALRINCPYVPSGENDLVDSL